ncbi:MAG: glycosyltransferase family 4 protein [Halobacteriota archaeon]|uniref:glycosyltransferase family 4 protein n=1 Tax=Natronomonas sp. TaxID=2184060 RepID=UPI003974A9BA
MTDADAPSILVIASHRPAEVLNSVSGMDAETNVLSLDADAAPPVRALAALRRTDAAIRRYRPDVVLLDCFETIGAPAAWITSRHGVPIVARLVGDHWRTIEEERLDPAWERRDIPAYLRHRISQALNQYILERADGYVVVSAALRDVVTARTGCPHERIGVVPVPITTDTFRTGSASAARERFGIETERVLLTVTNLKFRAKYDGVETILSEVLPLLRDDDELSYVVAGGGQHHETLVSELDDRIDDPDVRRRVHVLGYVDNVADLYALADVFAYVSDLDGYPNVVLEAQTAALPVVANDAHGMRDQISDGDTGFLVDPDSTGALRNRVEFLLDTPAERRRIGERARQRALRENDPGSVSDRLESFLSVFALDYC